jgi:hypothetical protein
MTETLTDTDLKQKYKEQAEAMHQYKATVSLQRKMAEKRKAHEALNSLLFQYKFDH